MKTFFGMPICIHYDRLPEEDYVALVRKRTHTPSRRAVRHIVMGIVGLICVGAFTGIAFWIAEDVASSLSLGFGVGLVLGMMAGVGVVFTAWSLYTGTQALRGNRTEKLLLEYHDRLNTARVCPSATDDPCTEAR